MAVIVENEPISGGWITVHDNGDYLVILGDTLESGTRTFYEYDTGPYDLQLLVARILDRWRLGRTLGRGRGTSDVPSDLFEGRRLEALRPERGRERSASPGADEGLPLRRRGSGTATLTPRPPPPCSGTAVPVTTPTQIRLGPVPPLTHNCTFSPLYEIFGESVRVRVHAVSPPAGDWGVSLYECPVRWPRDSAGEAAYCDRAFRGDASYFGPNGNDLVAHYDPIAWVSRKIFFRIRNGSEEPIPDVEISLEPVNRSPALQLIHDVLMLAGLLPGIGIAADGTDLILYVLEGDAGGAVMSAGALLPVFGDAAALVRLGTRSGVRVPQAVVTSMGRDALIEGMERETAAARRRGRTGSPDPAPREPAPREAPPREATPRETAPESGPRDAVPDAPEGRGSPEAHGSPETRAGDEASSGRGDSGTGGGDGGGDGGGSRRGRAPRSGRPDRLGEEAGAFVEHIALAEEIGLTRAWRILGSAGDDIMNFINRFFTVPGADRVVLDFLRGGTWQQGARYVMRYVEAHFPTATAGMVFEEVRGRLRRTDFRVLDVRYEFKSVMAFRGDRIAIRRQLRRDLADLLAQMPMSPDALRWVFDANRLDARFTRTFLIESMEDVITREFGDHPRAADLRAWLEAIVVVW